MWSSSRPSSRLPSQLLRGEHRAVRTHLPAAVHRVDHADHAGAVPAAHALLHARLALDAAPGRPQRHGLHHRRRPAGQEHGLQPVLARRGQLGLHAVEQRDHVALGLVDAARVHVPGDELVGEMRVAITEHGSDRTVVALREPLRRVDERRHAETAADEHVVGRLLDLEGAAERSEHVDRVPGAHRGEFGGAGTHDGEDQRDQVAADLADAERARQQLHRVVREQVDELRRLGMRGDVRVAEREPYDAGRQLGHFGDLDRVAAGEVARGGRLGDGRQERCAGHGDSLSVLLWFPLCLRGVGCWLRHDGAQVVAHGDGGVACGVGHQAERGFGAHRLAVRAGLPPGADDAARGVDDRAGAGVVEHAGHVAGGAALRAVAGHEEERVRHACAQRASLLGVRGADDRADPRIAVLPDGALAPTFHQIGHMLVDAAAAGQFELLDFAAGGVGGAHEREDVLVGGGGGLDERGDAVGAEVRVHGHRILMPRVVRPGLPRAKRHAA